MHPYIIYSCFIVSLMFNVLKQNCFLLFIFIIFVIFMFYWPTFSREILPKLVDYIEI